MIIEVMGVALRAGSLINLAMLFHSRGPRIGPLDQIALRSERREASGKRAGANDWRPPVFILRPSLLQAQASPVIGGRLHVRRPR